MKQAILDFETAGIEKRPHYPPKPVGLAFWLPGGEKHYAAWGHEGGDNGLFVLRGERLSKRDGDPHAAAVAALKAAAQCDSILGHNLAKFDADVSETHMGVKLPSAKIDDSLWSRFLVDPHAPTLSLKPSAERVLGEKPAERDAVFDWLFDHGRIQKIKGKYQKDAGAHICEAPGELVARYAIGDLTRSKGLWNHDMKLVRQNGMLEAYERERAVSPILLTNEREGIRCDMQRLESDLIVYEAALAKVEKWLRKKIGSIDNFDSDADVAFALRKSGQVPEKLFPRTPTGRYATSKKRLRRSLFRDPDVCRALTYRNIVAYVLGTNIRPWLLDGHIWTSWDQVRGASGGGARSGRITCSKLGNIIKNPTGGKNPDYTKPDDLRIRKKLGLPELPLARKYVLPDKGGLFGHRDANQEELRVCAHFEEGKLAAEYVSDPQVDIHGRVQGWMHSLTPIRYDREPVKTANFLAFYGGGWRALEAQTGMSESGAREFMRIWKQAMPDVVSLQKRCTSMHGRGEPIRTLGGRLYHCKPPGLNKHGEWTTFEYVALNYLIQPSGADLLKMWLIEYDRHPKRQGRLLCCVHDEINFSAPAKVAAQENALLKEIMETTFKLDVPWKTDGDERPNWGERS